MNDRQLRYFTTIFEQRNLSRAAALCNVAQSALSHHLGALEGELGVPLFYRKARGMEPTAAGVRLYEHARPILRHLDNAAEDVRTMITELAGEIRIGMPYSVVEGLTLPILEHVSEHLPKVRLSISEGLSRNTFDALVRGDSDLALFYNPNADARIETEPLVEEQIHCIGNPDMLGTAHAPIPFDTVCDLPVLLLRQGMYARAVVARTGVMSRLRNIGALEINSVNGLAKAMMAGFGCTLGPLITFREYLADGRLTARPIIDPGLTRTLHLGQLRDQTPTRLREEMYSLVKTLLAEEIAAGRWRGTLVGD